MISFTEIFRVTQVITTIKDKLDAAAAGIKDAAARQDAMDKRVYTIEARSRFERELRVHERMERLTERIAVLEAQLNVLMTYSVARNTAPPVRFTPLPSVDEGRHIC